MTSSFPEQARWPFWLPRFLLIAGLTCWIYWPVRHGGLVWDDGWYITTNPLLHDWRGLWKFWFQPGSWVEYYPIQETVLWVQYQLWGKATLGYHLTNIGLHIVNALLVWRLLGKFGLKLAWVGGLLFAVHPVQAESVAYISEMKNTLSLVFFLLTLLAWIDFEERKQRDDYVRALGWFLVAMLCKITMAPFGGIILLYAWWKRGRIGWDDLKAAVPFLIIALVLGLTTLWAGDAYVKQAHAVIPEIHLGGFFTRLANAGCILLFYLSISWLPFDLTPLYQKWTVDPGTLVGWLPWMVIGVSAGVLWCKRRGWGRHVLLGLGFFTLSLMPYLSFLSITYMMDTWIELHLLYFPAIGLIGLMVAGLSQLEARGPAALRIGVITMVTVMTVVAASQARAYAGWFMNEETLWTRVLARDPNVWAPHHNLGCNLLYQGRIPEALVELQEAVRLSPEYSDGHSNLGLALDRSGRPQEAQAQYREALKLNPENAKAWINLGDSLLHTGQEVEAIASYQHALQIAPEVAEVHYNLGSAFLHTGRLPEAIAHLQMAVQLDPGLALAQENLGAALAQTGRVSEAIGHFQAAVEINPEYILARNNLGLALAQSGRIAEAVEQFQLVLKTDPDNAMARSCLEQIRQALKKGEGK